MAKIDLSKVPSRRGSGYPKRFHRFKGDVLKREIQRVAAPSGITQFGVTRGVIEPGGVSSLRHWHTEEDEFAIVLEGELILIQDEGETVMRAGDMAAFPKGVANGHHFLNRSDKPAVLIAIGPHMKNDICTYSDVDMKVSNEDDIYRTRAGVPYEDVER